MNIILWVKVLIFQSTHPILDVGSLSIVILDLFFYLLICRCQHKFNSV